jgi:hypothetical protein
MNKFEQLIEYVINDDEAKARELFHNIVVEKSRAIYEEMMEDDTVEEGFGGDAADDLIDDVEVEEEGLSEEDDEMGGDEMGDDDMGDMAGDDMAGDDEAQGEEDLEDRVVDLEDKLDELMAEFESMMGDEGGEDMDMDMDGDEGDGEVDMDADLDQAEYDDEAAADVDMMENVTLKAVPKPTHGDAGANSKSPVAANSGAKGALAKPVSTGGDGGNGRPAPTAKEAIGRVGNTPAQSTQNPTPATKPHLAQATGVNNKSPLASR